MSLRFFNLNRGSLPAWAGLAGAALAGAVLACAVVAGPSPQSLRIWAQLDSFHFPHVRVPGPGGFFGLPRGVQRGRAAGRAPAPSTFAPLVWKRAANFRHLALRTSARAHRGGLALRVAARDSRPAR